jgi:hypothetical protein
MDEKTLANAGFGLRFRGKRYIFELMCIRKRQMRGVFLLGSIISTETFGYQHIHQLNGSGVVDVNYLNQSRIIPAIQRTYKYLIHASGIQCNDRQKSLYLV